MPEFTVILRDEREGGHIAMLEEVFDKHYNYIKECNHMQDVCLIGNSMCEIAKTIHLIRERKPADVKFSGD